MPFPVVVPGWVEPVPRESLAGYAHRMADRLEVGPPFFLGGMSIGGMLALEMSRWVRAEAVLMIASGRSGRALRPLYRVLGYLIGSAPLWAGAPPRLSRPVATFFAHHLLPSARRLRGGQREFFAAIARDCSPRLVRWGCRAAPCWPGMDSVNVPVHHVHGECDLVFPLERVRPDRVIPGGGHLINLTHAAEVNAFLYESIEVHLSKGICG